MGTKASSIETPFLQDFLESEAQEKEPRKSGLPWNIRETANKGKTAPREVKDHLTDFVVGFFLGTHGDQKQ